MTLDTAIVLAGGKSVRLGQDKARVIYQGDTLLARMLRTALTVCSEAWVIGRDPSAQGVTAPWLLDDIPGRGPMGGIATALRHLGRPVLALSCDIPLITPDLLRRLLHAHDSTTLATFFVNPDNLFDPMPGIYEPAALPLLDAALAKGDHKLSRILDETVRKNVPYSAEEAPFFLNINRPADLEILLRHP